VPAEGPRSVRSSAWRFLLAGGFNTAVTGVLLSALARVMDPRLAYTLAFAVGIALAVALAGGFVFGVTLTRRLAGLYTAMYVAIYLVGLVAVALAARAGMAPEWSGLVVFVTAPLTFVGGRLLLTPAAGRRPVHERTPR